MQANYSIKQDLRVSLDRSGGGLVHPAHGVLIICAGRRVVLRSAADPRRVPSESTVSDETEPTSAADTVYNFLGQPWALNHAACVKDPWFEARALQVVMFCLMCVPPVL
jgi:hypothetical protein